MNKSLPKHLNGSVSLNITQFKCVCFFSGGGWGRILWMKCILLNIIFSKQILWI